MDDIQKLPLADQIRRAKPVKNRLPAAAGLCDFDFFSIVGEITGQEQRYIEIYQSQIAPYGTADGKIRCICDLAVTASKLPSPEGERLLFWTLVEPFATIHKKEQNERNDRKETP